MPYRGAERQPILFELRRKPRRLSHARGNCSQKPTSSSTADEGRFSIGSVIGERFRILGRLGGGGMGSRVTSGYIARTLDIARLAACKR
jgi:hypothetical protein